MPDANAILSLSIGELAEFACRRGDLVGDNISGPTAQEGIRAHQKLQKQRPKSSEAEYRLQVNWQCDGQALELSGRVDILHPQTDLHRPVQLDEIKTTYRPPEQLQESVRDRHWAQLKLYGFCYGLQHQKLVQHQKLHQQQVGNSQSPQIALHIALQMVWYNLKEKKTYPDLREFHWSELEAFARTVVSSYLQWHRQWQQHLQRLRESARALQFPFEEYRPGQRSLAVAAYRCLRDGGELVVEAPTGIGKTVSTLFPAIKAVGEGQVDQLVYLTAKNSGRQVVRDTITRLQQQGLKLSLLEIQARDKTCACRLGLCSRDADGVCPRTQGFFDRLPQARETLLHEPMLTADVVAGVADRWHLCPFALALEMLPWVDLVVCDFNYVFDPLVRLSALLSSDRRRALLVDEAHNLGDRARAMHSASLNRRDSQQAAAICKGSQPGLRRAIQSLVRALEHWVAECQQLPLASGDNTNPQASLWVMDTLAARPTKVTRAAEKLLAEVSLLWEQSLAPPEAIADWLKAVFRYLVIEQLLTDESHRGLTRMEHQGKWPQQQLTLLCLTAAQYLQQTYSQFHAVIVFSATLRPADFVYRELGLQMPSPYLQLPSPFESRQLGVFVCPYVDTRYRARHQSIDALVDMVARVFHSRAGNYLVFFPSYQFMQQLAERFSQTFPDIELLLQVPGASECEREAFLAHFREGRQSLGFAIMGGVFGEGIDYVGEQLVGTVIVGVGLPQINPQQELLRQVYDQDRLPGRGFDYAYRYPGLTRVLQAAGRVIRTESDRGVLILADHRFTQAFYQSLYPNYWNVQYCPDGEWLSTELQRFWLMQ